MRKSKFTEEQIAFALKRREMGTAASEISRKLGISEQTFYRWKKLYGGHAPSEVRRLKQLEDENRRLRRFRVPPHVAQFLGLARTAELVV